MNLDLDDSGLPGADLVAEGLLDLREGRETDAALLVLIASPRLKALGLEIPETGPERCYEHELYARLEQRTGKDAHSQYNSLIRRIVSFTHALERQESRDAER